MDGSSTPVVFTIPLASDKTVFLAQIRFFGGGSGVKYGQILSKNVILTNGIEVAIKTDDNLITLPLIKTTEDFKNVFASTPSDFKIDIQSGADQFIATLQPALSFPLRPAGTFTTDDFIKITIQDDLTSGISQLEALGVGFER